MAGTETTVGALRARGGEDLRVRDKSYLLVPTGSGIWEAYSEKEGWGHLLGAARSREDAVAIVEDVASGRSAKRADEFWSRFDATVGAVRPTVKALVAAAGLEAYHTGGGCMAWMRRLPDEDQILVCAGDNTLDADPDAMEWTVGRHGHEGGFIEISEPLTLAGAIAMSDRIPAPRDSNGEVIETQFADADAAISAIAGREAAIEAAKARMGYPNMLRAEAIHGHGPLCEVGLIGPGLFGDEYAVAMHRGCEPRNPASGDSVVTTHATLEEAVEEWDRTIWEGRALASPNPGTA